MKVCRANFVALLVTMSVAVVLSHSAHCPDDQGRALALGINKEAISDGHNGNELAYRALRGLQDEPQRDMDGVDNTDVTDDVTGDEKFGDRIKKAFQGPIKKALTPAGDKIKKGLMTAGDKITSGLTTVGDKITSGLTTVGAAFVPRG